MYSLLCGSGFQNIIRAYETSCHQILQCPFDLLILKDVDVRVAQLSNHAVEERYIFVKILTTPLAWSDVPENGAAIQNSDHNEMSRACGKGFFPAC